ncbi:MULTISPECIES: hypothetical protein [Streptomyces]
MTIAALPDHNRVTDPTWLKLFHDYRHVITPLRHNSWTTDVELCGREIRADLGDGTELIVAAEFSLPADPAEVTGWTVVRQNVEEPHRHSVLYDSTPTGPQRHHKTSLMPMFARIDELDVPKSAIRLTASATYSASYGLNQNQGGVSETPGVAVARFYEWSHHLMAVEGYQRVWERPHEDGYPLAVFEKSAHICIVRVGRSDD